MMKKMVRRTIASVLFIIPFLCSTVTAQAHEAVELDRKDCELTIEMKYDGAPVPGGELTLYRVGDVVENNGDFGFAWAPDLNCAVEIANLESRETASKVLNCVKRTEAKGITASTDGDGRTTFENLEVGLYLVEQKCAASGFSAISPFLISLPRWEEDRYVYSVTATAKAELHREPTPTGEAPNTSAPILPKTGQLNWPIPLFALAGITLLVAGFVLRCKKKNA